MTKEEQFVNELIGYIFAYPDDDYMTMECLCRKLVKHGLLDKVDGYYQMHEIRTNTHECVKDTHDKTEPTISKMEQVDKDINVRSKTEPQIGEMMTEEEFDSMLARLLTGKDEPQTDCAWK